MACSGGAIDVGDACTNRVANGSDDFTRVFGNNPANDTGTIDCVCVYGASGTGLKVGTFYDADPANLKFAERGGSLMGDGTYGVGETQYTAGGADFVAYNVTSGDFSGGCWATGTIDYGVDAGTLWYDADTNCGEWPRDGSVVFTAASPFTFAVYQEGEVAGVGAVPLLVGGCMGQTTGSNCNLMTG